MAETLHLLLVEDSPDDAALVLRELRRGGLNVQAEVVETEEAFRSVIARGPVDLIISDFHLPSFSGSRALAALQDLGQDLPFIVVSGTIGEETAVATMKAGASDYIMKDRLQRLVPAVQRELREAEGRRQRRFAEAEREQLRSHLLQSQKMEALGTFAGGIAHDFNNLLTVIVLNLQLASLEVSDRTIAAYLEEARASSERASVLVRQLLCFSRRRDLDLESLDLNALVRNIVSMVERLMPASIVCKMEFEPEVWPIHADASSIEQVLIDLITNARDAMPTGGTITVRTTNRSGEWRPGCEAPTGPGDYVVLSVTDEGTGIDDAIKERIFEPFFTTKPQGEGTGLGLSMIYGIAEQHEGWISVDSEIGSGSSFLVFIPRQTPPA